MDVSDTDRQLAILGLAVVSIVHLLVPGRLLQTARYSYSWILDVDFSPRDGAKRRVRLLGILLAGVAAALWRRDA
jgi:hypothetical protein